MQSTYINPQQYAGQPAQLSGMSDASSSPFPMTSWPSSLGSGMTQLPNVPRPPYLQPSTTAGTMAQQASGGSPPMQTTSYIIPGVFGNRPASAQTDYLPPPCEAAPSFCTEKPQAYQTASSFPVNALDSAADVPSPYMAAPWLYLAKPQTPVVPAQAPIQQPMPAQPQQQWPPQQAQPKMPAQQPQQQPPAPPQQPQQPASPSAQPPQQAQEKVPTTPLEHGGLTDEIIRSLNKRLNDDNEATRADAAMDLFKILDKDPDLSKLPPYNQYVNAFIEKIMKDPSAVVRAPGELALSSGLVVQPSHGTWQKLKQLEEQGSGLSGEGEIISKLLGGFQQDGSLNLGPAPKKGGMTNGPGIHEDEKRKTADGQEADPNQQQAQGAQTQAGQVLPNAQGQQPQAGQFPQGAPQPTSAGMPPQPQLQQQAAYPQPQLIAPVQPMPQGPQGNPYGQAQQFGQQAGNRFNYLSQAQSPVMSGYGGMNPQVGQKLNIQEGYRQ